MGASSSVQGEKSPAETQPTPSRRFWPKRFAPFMRSSDYTAESASTPSQQTTPQNPENADAAPTGHLDSLESGDLDGKRQTTGKVAPPVSAMSLSPTRLRVRADTNTVPAATTGLAAPTMPRFNTTALSAGADGSPVDNPINNKACLTSAKLLSTSQGGISGPELLSGRVRDAPISTNSAASTAQSTRRQPVVSFRAPTKPGNAAGPGVKVVSVTPAATPVVVPAAPVVTTTADGARHIFQKLPGYPGYAQSIKALEVEAHKKGRDEEKREKDARANRSKMENESSISLLGTSTAESRVYADKVSKQVVQASSDLDTYTAHIRVLLRSWEIASLQYDDLVSEVGEVMSAEHPEYAQLFRASSLSAQARVMVDMIGEALMIISRPNEMFEKLLEMGALHRRYNVGEEYFLALKEVFIAVLPKYLPTDMRDSCEAAWEPFWGVVIPLLMHGRSSARGDWHAQQQQEAFLAEARRIMGEIMARKTSSERGTFMLEMLEGAVELDATMERFALLRERRTAIRAFTGIVRMLDGTTDLAATQLLMEDLAFRHSVYGLDAAGMRGFRQPFIETCHYSMWKKKCLDLWHHETPRSLGEFWDYVTESWDTAMQSNAKARMAQAERAPDGTEPFCLMFTDIEASTRLWERNAAVMGDAVDAHHRIIRSAISDYGAYEVKTVGDSFVIAAKNVLIAVRIALAIQLELMRGPIANGFEMVSDPQGSGPAHCWRSDSLRVRVGIHYCRDASAVYDSVQRRYDYYGPSVNCTARVESAASGGQILMTEEALEALQDMPELVDHPVVVLTDNEPPDELQSAESSYGDSHDLLDGARPLADLITVRDWGQHTFKGIANAVQLYSVWPGTLVGRCFGKAASSVGPAASRVPLPAALGC